MHLDQKYKKTGDSMMDIPVMYVRYDDEQLSRAVHEALQANSNINLITISGERFPFAKQLLNATENPYKIVILHMLAGCHELGYRECDENQSTGLRRAEILRKEGFQGEIIILTHVPVSHISWLHRSIIRNYDKRVTQARVHFACYDDCFKNIVDTVVNTATK